MVVSGQPYDWALGRAQATYQKSLADPSIRSELLPQIAEAQKRGERYAEQLGEAQTALNRQKERTVELAQKEYELGQRTLDVTGRSWA